VIAVVIAVLMGECCSPRLSDARFNSLGVRGMRCRSLEQQGYQSMERVVKRRVFNGERKAPKARLSRQIRRVISGNAQKRV
jgi:hypothetical protein